MIPLGQLRWHCRCQVGSTAGNRIESLQNAVSIQTTSYIDYPCVPFTLRNLTAGRSAFSSCDPSGAFHAASASSSHTWGCPRRQWPGWCRTAASGSGGLPTMHSAASSNIFWSFILNRSKDFRTLVTDGVACRLLPPPPPLPLMLCPLLEVSGEIMLETALVSRVVVGVRLKLNTFLTLGYI